MRLERDFYSVAQVASRWGVTAEEVLHQADCGRLVLSVSLLGRDDLQIRRSRENGYSGNILPEIPMIFDLPIWDARSIAREGKADDVDTLFCRNGMVEIKVISDLLHLTTNDVLVTSKELERFEKLALVPTALPDAATGDDTALPVLDDAQQQTDAPPSGATEKEAPEVTPAGISKKAILSVEWPLPAGAPTLEKILNNLPKWVEPACKKVGRVGKGADGSHLWNPAVLAAGLATTTPQKKWKANKAALTNLLSRSFPEYLQQWEEALERF